MSTPPPTGKRRIGEGAPGPGRPKGTPNKSTAAVRDAIARVLQGNAENFGFWLTKVAEGEKQPRIKDGKPVLDASGAPLMKWLRRPDPGFALRLAMDMAEYHIPRLSRSTIDGEIGVRGKLVINE